MALFASGGINSQCLKGVRPSQEVLLQNGSCATPDIYSRSNRVNLKCTRRALTGSDKCRMLRAAKLNRIPYKFESIPKNQSGVLAKEDAQGRKKLAVFVSGGGSNFRALHQATVNDLIYGDIAVLVTDKPSCRASDYAKENNIPVIIFPKSTTEPSGLSSMDLITTLRDFEINFLLLAGYLKLIPVELVQAFSRSILNIHPSLLPAFGGKGYYGMKVHKAVIASGARVQPQNTISNFHLVVVIRDSTWQQVMRLLQQATIGCQKGYPCCQPPSANLPSTYGEVEHQPQGSVGGQDSWMELQLAPE